MASAHFLALFPAIRHAAAILTSGALVAVSPGAFGGPFGLEMGMTTQQLKAAGVDVPDNNNGVIKTARVPKPHDAFESYTLIVDSQRGLCKIGAIGKDIRMNSFGDQVQEQFKALESALTETYGPGQRFDFLQRGSIWNERKDWAMGLLKDERTLAAAWGGQGSSFQGKDNVATILLEAKATSSSVGFVTLTYDFKNAGPCLDALRKRKNGVL